MPAGSGRIDWKARAEQLAIAVPCSKLHPAVLAWTATASATGTWVVAFSGGADSLALLLLVWAHWPDHRKRLVAAHFNHRLRGVASDRDEQFCATVAESLGIRWRAGRWKEAVKGASEGAARVARHAFFAKELRRFHAHALWVGHQQDDIAETMLMRLARGSGTAGLAAPRPVQAMTDGRVFLRPLLTVKKLQVIEHLEAGRIPWREDLSNATGRFLRNRTRHDVIPVWIEANAVRDALAGAALARELLEEDDAALEAWLTGLNCLTPRGALNLRKLTGRPRALVRRALNQWLGKNKVGAKLSRQGFSAILDDLMSGRSKKHSVGDGFAVISATRLTFERGSRKLSN